MVLYNYDSNGIMIEAAKSTGDDEALRVYKRLYKKLTKRGFMPVLNILDNTASAAVKRHLEKNRGYIPACGTE